MPSDFAHKRHQEPAMTTNPSTMSTAQPFDDYRTSLDAAAKANRPGGIFSGPFAAGGEKPPLTPEGKRMLIRNLETQLKQLQAEEAMGRDDAVPAPTPREIVAVSDHAQEIQLLVADLLTHAQDLQRENWRLRDRIRALEQAAHGDLELVRSQIVAYADQMQVEHMQHEPDADSMPPFTMRGR